LDETGLKCILQEGGSIHGVRQKLAWIHFLFSGSARLVGTEASAANICPASQLLSLANLFFSWFSNGHLKRLD